jgi:hypothetical protein
MSDLSIFAQLTIILGALCLVLAIALVNQVNKRRSIVHELLDAKIASQASKQQITKYKFLVRSMPEWLASTVNSARYELILDGVATWLDYARGNLLLAMVGSIVAFLGALLAASGLVLFGVVGAGVMVVGFQILYAAVQDAGIFRSVQTATAAKENTASSKARASSTGTTNSEP